MPDTPKSLAALALGLLAGLLFGAGVVLIWVGAIIAGLVLLTPRGEMIKGIGVAGTAFGAGLVLMLAWLRTTRVLVHLAGERQCNPPGFDVKPSPQRILPMNEGHDPYPNPKPSQPEP